MREIKGEGAAFPDCKSASVGCKSIVGTDNSKNNR
jgi:hypothetical protein